ncbi:hypothetical protein TL16_g12027 [Triparma laevis f. inornata]|uniref:Bromo domain-containing protein n=1 Tax=Triparma laevis f. inornata TaxID=1714386 RepID=A0A9W7EVG7_9STRA|nr:hypothetical protein TL16_g12027 [Triparma laevis f. inornata]
MSSQPHPTADSSSALPLKPSTASVYLPENDVHAYGTYELKVNPTTPSATNEGLNEKKDVVEETQNGNTSDIAIPDYGPDYSSTWTPELYKLTDLAPINPTNTLLSRLVLSHPPRLSSSTFADTATTTSTITTKVQQDIASELLHYKPVNSSTSPPPSSVLVPPRKISPRLPSTLCHSILSSLAHSTTTASPHLQSLSTSSTLHVTIDAIHQHVTSTTLLTYTRPQIVSFLNSPLNLGSLWFKYTVSGGEGEIGEVEFERGSSENREWREYAGREVGVEVVEEEDVEEVPDGRELVRISIDEVGEGKGKTKKTSGFTVEGVWENWRKGLERTLRGRGELKNTNGNDAMDVDSNPTDTSATPDGTPATPLPPQPIDLAGVQVSRALNLDPITPTPTVQKLLALGFPFLLQTLSQLTLDSKITLIYSSDDVLQTRYKVNKERSRDNRSYTKWKGMGVEVKDKEFKTRMAAVKEFETTCLESSEKLTALTPEQEEIGMISTLPKPVKPDSEFISFSRTNFKKNLDYLKLEPNNNPVAGYHKECNSRSGRIEVHFWTPTGVRLRSKVEAKRYLERQAALNLPVDVTIEQFDYRIPLVSQIWQFPKMDPQSLVKQRLSKEYERLGGEEKNALAKEFKQQQETYLSAVTKYREWKRVKDFITEQTSTSSTSTGPRFPKRKRKSVSNAAYADKTLNVSDLAAKAVRQFIQPSTIVDVERNVFMRDVSDVTVEKGAAMMDSSSLAQIRTTLGALMRKGAVERVFADIERTDGQNFFKAVLVNECVRDMEVKVAQYELKIKHTEMTLRRLILTQLQIDPQLISRAAIGAESPKEVIDELTDDDWMTADNFHLKNFLLDANGQVAEVVAWSPEVEVVLDDLEDDSNRHVVKPTEVSEQDVIKGRVVQRQALFKARVIKEKESKEEGKEDNIFSPVPVAVPEPEPEFWILSEFQVRALNEAYRLREQLKDTLKQIEGETIYTSFKSKLGKRLQFCEYDVVPSPNGGSAILDKTNPKWFPATCVGVDPQEGKILLLPDGCKESFWGHFDTKIATFYREGDEPKDATKLIFAGDGVAFAMATNFLKWVNQQPDAWLFLQPVDPVALGIPDYPDIIKKPMDLQTMQLKLDKGFYNKADGECDFYGRFWKDLELMFSNAVVFNGPSSEVAHITNRLKKKCEKKLMEVMKNMKKGNGVADFGLVDTAASNNSKNNSNIPLHQLEYFIDDQQVDLMAEDDEMNPYGKVSSTKMKYCPVEEGMRLSKLIPELPISSDVSSFTLKDDWIAYRVKETAAENGAEQARAVRPSTTASTSASKGEKDFISALGLGFLRRDDPTVKVLDRTELENWIEENHNEMAALYQQILIDREPKKKKERVKGWVDASDSGVKGALKMRKGKTGLMINVRAEDFDKVKKQLEEAAQEAKRKKVEEAEEELFNKNFHNNFPPYLGSVGEDPKGGIVWEIRKAHIVPALRHVLRGMIQSGHVFEIESIGVNKNSPGGGTVSAANYYIPSVPFSILPRKPPSNKGKRKKLNGPGYVAEGESEDGPGEEKVEDEPVVEMSDYEKARVERVARNNAYLKSLGLA